jgi:hypothetical protein
MTTSLTWFLPVVPIALVWLVGAIIAVTTWKRHPNVSLLALLGCLILLFATVAGSAGQFWIVNQQVAAGWPGGQMSLWLSAIGFVRSGLGVIGYILLLCAVFSGRGWTGRRYTPGPVDVSLHPPPRDPDPGDAPRDSEDIQKRPHWE